MQAISRTLETQVGEPDAIQRNVCIIDGPLSPGEAVDSLEVIAVGPDDKEKASVMSAEERSRDHLESLIAKIQQREERLGKAVLQFAASRENSNLKLCVATVNFLSRAERPVEQIHYDYEKFIIVRKLARVDDVMEMLSGLKGGTLEIPDFGSVTAPGDISQEPIFIPSGLNYGPVATKWPTWYCEYSIERKSMGSIPDDDLVKLSLPLFPSGKSAVKNLFGLRREFDRWSDALVLFLVPDYRARIGTLRIGINTVTVTVEAQEMDEEKLIAKFYSESSHGIEQSEVVQVEDGVARFSTKSEPFYVNVHILDSSTGEDLDSCDFDLRRPKTQEKVILEKAQYQMEELIKRGESDQLEFKVDLKDHARFLQTVVAFANASGGRVLLGVDDNGQIAGYMRNDADRITNLISSHCNPPIEVSIHAIQLKERILVVEVPEGSNKPYEYRERGFYMRRGATNRLVTRSDMDQIYVSSQLR